MAAFTDSTTTPEIRATATRRAAIGLVAGSAIVAAPGLLAAMEADPLEALWIEYQEACKRFTAASETELSATQTAKREHPPRPSSLYGQNVHSGKTTPLDRETLTRWRDTAMKMQIGGVDRFDHALSIMCKWEAACDAVDRLHGVDVLSEHAEALCLAMDAIEGRIVETVPRSMRGVAIKLKLAAKWGAYEDDENETDIGRIILRLIADLEAGL